MRDRAVVLAAAALMIGGGLAGFAGYRAWQTHNPPASGLVPAPPLASTAASPEPSHAAVPEQLPDVTLPDLAGHPRNLRDFLGSPLIVNFWATWCAPCRREIPLLQELKRSHQADRLEIVGLAVDFKPAVSQYIEHTPLPYPVLIGEDQGMVAAEKFGMEPVLPFSVFSDAQGQIVAIKIGELHRDEADYILDAMHSLAAGHESLPQIRARIAGRLRELSVARAKESPAEAAPQ